MGIFGNISAFRGLGKASLKLDFETETQLKDFARRYIVDEGDETPDNDPDPEKAAKAIINNLYRRTTGDAYMKPHKGGVDGPGDVYIITDTRSKAKKELDEIKALQKYDVQKFNKEALKDIEDSDPLLFEQLKSDLKGLNAPGDRYELIDNREKQRKNIDDLKEISTKDIELKLIERKPKKSKFENDNFVKIYIWQSADDNSYYTDIPFFAPETKTNKGYQGEIKNGYKGYDHKQSVNVDINQVKDLTEEYSSVWRKKYWFGFIPKTYYKELKKEAINKYIEVIKSNIAENAQYYKEGNQREKYIALNNKRIKYVKEFYDLGRTADNTLYNNNDLMECQGMMPTYKILPSYDKFFRPAKQKNTFAGFGLDDTKALIADICRKYYKECAPIAAHLKGDSLLQSCFNLWHWMRHNIRYEYDRDDREEVRTPLRVWADRQRGVDCDCLSVFAWCVLKCMGFNPVFELVAFKEKPTLSHIFVNCDGVVVDRVWFQFNKRPPYVTKRELYKVELNNNDLGKLF